MTVRNESVERGVKENGVQKSAFTRLEKLLPIYIYKYIYMISITV